MNEALYVCVCVCLYMCICVGYCVRDFFMLSTKGVSLTYDRPPSEIITILFHFYYIRLEFHEDARVNSCVGGRARAVCGGGG